MVYYVCLLFGRSLLNALAHVLGRHWPQPGIAMPLAQE